MGFSAVIPAFNEADRLGHVLATVTRCPTVVETIVVNDGSTDATADIARQYGVKLIDLPSNEGKGHALARGVAAAKKEQLIFLDADLENLDCSHLRTLARAYKELGATMVLGLRDYQLPISQRVMPSVSGVIGGERVLSRRLFEDAVRDFGYRPGYSVDMALTRAALARGCVAQVSLGDVRHKPQYLKGGLPRYLRITSGVMRGLIARGPSARAGTRCRVPPGAADLPVQGFISPEAIDGLRTVIVAGALIGVAALAGRFSENGEALGLSGDDLLS